MSRQRVCTQYDGSLWYKLQKEMAQKRQCYAKEPSAVAASPTVLRFLGVAQGFVSKEKIRAQYDGSLWYILEKETAQKKQGRIKERQLRRAQKKAA